MPTFMQKAPWLKALLLIIRGKPSETTAQHHASKEQHAYMDMF